MAQEQEEKVRTRLFKDKPLAVIELSEFEKPGTDRFTNLRRFCISLGLISPGESRIAIVHILDILLKARKSNPNGLDSYAIVKELYQHDVKIVYANILRDLRKLVRVGLVEKINGGYRVKENGNLEDILRNFIKPYIIERILNRIVEYAHSIESE